MIFPADHRAWPPPAHPWVLAQTWCDLLFAHWPLPPATLRPLVPAAMELDLRDGVAWLAVVPFRMERIRPRGLISIPCLSDTPELNVRTYVTAGGRPGVYFFSLDAANAIAVRIARRFFYLPYYRARMRLRPGPGESIDYESSRLDEGAASFRATYGPTGPVFHAQPGTLENWLTERYCFYTLDPAGRLCRGDIHHPPWPLQPADAELQWNTMTAPLSLSLPDTPPLLHFAGRLDVVAWTPSRNIS